MIMAFVGGMGTGKTLLNAYFCLCDLEAGRRVFTNIKFKPEIEKKYKDKIIYMTSERIETLLEDLHNKTIDFKNSTLAIQEIHNYLDSRSNSLKNRVFSYFLLQSRHASGGLPFNIQADTQNLGQVDVRFRRNCEVVFKPTIIERDLKNKPLKIRAEVIGFMGQDHINGSIDFDVKGVCDKYDSWEIVDFSYKLNGRAEKNGKGRSAG